MSVLSYELAQHRLARENVDVRIEPDLGGIRAHEFHRADEAIEAGRSAARVALPDIERSLKRRSLLSRLRSGAG
jgi:predicted acylesterase/phospholipase RssA